MRGQGSGPPSAAASPRVCERARELGRGILGEIGTSEIVQTSQQNYPLFSVFAAILLGISIPSPFSALAASNFYTNVSGSKVQVLPVHAVRALVGVTARCRDDFYSYSRHRRGTCSHHGGVRLGSNQSLCLAVDA